MIRDTVGRRVSSSRLVPAAFREGVAVFICTLGLLLSGSSLSAGVFVVSSTGDAGPGTLRLAITQANAAVGRDTIVFAFLIAPPWVISPLSPLPPLQDPAGVFINGFSAPGASAGNAPPWTAVLRVELDGSRAGAAHGLWIVSPNNTVQGLVIRNFQQDGIRVQAAMPATVMNRIFANFIGTDRTGSAAAANGWNLMQPWAGVNILAPPGSPGAIAQSNTVRCNLVSGNAVQGVSISSCPPADVSFNWVDSNAIGTSISGRGALGNRHDGVYIGEAAHDNFIVANVISANDTDGVSIVGYIDHTVRWLTSSNHVLANIIGMGLDRVTPLPNGRHGVSIGKYGSVWMLGHAPSNDISTNLIAHNRAHGVMVWEHPADANNTDNNRVTGNTMYFNGGLGIDLDDDGVSINDVGDPDSRANQTLNTPTVASAQSAGASVVINGSISIDTDPLQAQVEVFLAARLPSGSAQGRTLLGTAAPDAAGQWTLTVTGPMTASDSVTATVIDLVGNTSEFSAPCRVNGPMIAGIPVRFGTVRTGSTGSSSLMIRNTGQSVLTVSAMTAAPAVFSIPPISLPLTVPARDSVLVLLQFNPVTAGAVSGTVAITSDATNARVLTLSLDGTGVDSSAEIATPDSLLFGTVELTDTIERGLPVRSTGNLPLTVTATSVWGSAAADFTVATVFPLRIPAGGSDTIRVRFQPSATGDRAASLRITSDAQGEPSRQVGLRGTGIPAPQPRLSVTPSALAFPRTMPAGSARLTVRLRNDGSGALHLGCQCVRSGDSTVFSVVQYSAVTIPAGGTDSVHVLYAPLAWGAHVSLLMLASDDPVNPLLAVPLSGVCASSDGAAMEVLPSTIDFGTIPLFSSAADTVRITSTGAADLLMQQQTLYGMDASSFSIVQPATSPLPTGARSEVRLLFAPLTAGRKTATLRLITNDAQRPLVDIPINGITVGASLPPSMPRTVALAQNHPNPFDDRTTFILTLAAGERVRLVVRDLLGRVVRVLHAGTDASGRADVVWDRRDGRGERVPAGIYRCMLECDCGSPSAERAVMVVAR